MNDVGFTLNAKFYNFLKWTALVLLPAAASLYFGLGAIWNFAAVEQVVGTITLVDTFLGLIVSRSSSNYSKSPSNLANAQPVGKIVVRQDEDGNAEGMRFEAYLDPFVVPDQEKVVFDVGREPGH